MGLGYGARRLASQLEQAWREVLGGGGRDDLAHVARACEADLVEALLEQRRRHLVRLRAGVRGRGRGRGRVGVGDELLVTVRSPSATATHAGSMCLSSSRAMLCDDALAYLRVQRRRIGDVGRAPRPHRSLPLAPERPQRLAPSA